MMRLRMVLAVGVVAALGCETTEPPPRESSSAKSANQFLTSSTTSMNHPRANLTLTTLADGRVLAVGGDLSVGAAEIYDPTTATWTDTGSLNVPRSVHQAVLLNSGRVLITGGISQLLDPPDEVFDPATSTFTIVGTNEPSHLFAVRLADGRVLEINGPGWPSRLFDETTQTFTAAPSTAISHAQGAALLLDDGRVFVAGGTSGTASVEAYSPVSGTWSALAPTSLPRAYASAIKLPDGSVLLVNGSSGPLDIFQAVFNRYTPTTNSWATFGSDRSSTNPLLALSTTGTVYSLGGYGNAFAEVIDPATNGHRRLGSLLSTHSVGAIASLGQGQFLIAGGYRNGGPQSDVELYSECTPTTTCAASNAGCGWVPDDCGGNVFCGSCDVNSVCTANQCVCVPRTCAEQAKNCGDTTDGCGAPLNCGTCTAPQQCSASNVCFDPGIAIYNATLKAPACLQAIASCDSMSLLVGRAGFESNTPNTVNNSCSDGTAGAFHVDLVARWEPAQLRQTGAHRRDHLEPGGHFRSVRCVQRRERCEPLVDVHHHALCRRHQPEHILDHLPAAQRRAAGHSRRLPQGRRTLHVWGRPLRRS
jgi:Kelch motif